MEDISRQLRKGMEVYSVDGAKIGKISQIWYGTVSGGPTPTEEETCIEVHRGFLGREHLYLPCHIVAKVDQNKATLNVDEQIVHETPSWHRKPMWIG
jgi:hypothetical protein